MRRAVLAWAFGVVAGCHAEPVRRQPEPAPLARVLEVVREAHLPLVVFFHAPWCQGCREFIRDVLSDRALAKALGDTPMVAYDVDTENGRDAAASYKLRGIPSLVAVDREGVTTVLPGMPDVAGVVAFLQKARVLTAPEPAASPPAR
jgi:thiol:disulfide interchange protein